MSSDQKKDKSIGGNKIYEEKLDRVIDILENKYYLIRKEKRSGSTFYELAHDRLISAINASNNAWNYEKEKKSNRLKFKIVLPIIIIIAGIIIGFIITQYYSPNPPSSNLPHEITVGASPSDVAVNPKTNMVYVVNYGSDTTSIIDGTTNKVVSNVTVGTGPNGVDVNPNTNMLYVANNRDNTVSVINGTTNKGTS